MKEKKTAYAALVVHEEKFDAEIKVTKVKKFSQMCRVHCLVCKIKIFIKRSRNICNWSLSVGDNSEESAVRVGDSRSGAKGQG